MSSYFRPKIGTFKAAGAIAVGNVVIGGADNAHVAISASGSAKNIGIAQSASVNAEDLIEVALPGGGAKALAGGTVAFGDLLTSDGNGALVVTTTPGDRYVAMAMDAADAGDLFSVHMVAGLI